MNLEVLHRSGSSLLGTGQILQGCDGLLRAEVDDQQVGSLSRLLRLPVGRLLQVEDLVAQMVAVLLLRVSVLRLPRFAGNALAVLSLQVEFGDGGAVAVLLGTETLYGKVAAPGGLTKLDSLPAVASLEGSSGDGGS